MYVAVIVRFFGYERVLLCRTMSNPAPSSGLGREGVLHRLLQRPRLAVWIVLLGVGLTSPSLFIGFHLDDLIGRFIYSDLPGADRLFRIYAGGYGAASGNPEDAAWMMEQGYAPWWMDPELLIWFYRPLSLVTHLVDAQLWPDSAFMWHAHSLLWFAALLAVAVRTYRSILGPAIGGLAGLLFALDHTHGVPVGFIANRYILIAMLFSMLMLEQHHRARAHGSRMAQFLAPLCYGLGLFSGESTVAVVGYLVAYATFVDTGSLRSRVLSLAPYFFATVLWRVGYSALGRGSRGSDLYLDPIREPLRFAVAVLERGPMLLLGQWFGPPAELYTFVEAGLAMALIGFAWLFMIALGVALAPVLKRDKVARFWAAGMVLALVPMCAGEPNNRMLFAASIGAMGLLASWWSLYADTLKDAFNSALGRFSRAFGNVMVVLHLFSSAVFLPLMACSLLMVSPLKDAFADVGPEAAGKEAVFVTSPDYWAVRLMRMTKEVEGQATPSRWRALAFGSEQVTVYRQDERTLVLEYAGGAMREPGMTKQALDLYRSRNKPMVVGQRVFLEDLSIEVLEVTDDGRPRRARFEFARPLDDPRYLFYHWVDNHFRPLGLPVVGSRKVLPRAVLVPYLPGRDA